MKRVVSLVLVLALILSVCAIPAQASGIGTGILVAASAASVISAALIGLGVLPGTDGSVFDGIVSGAADYLSSIGFGDGVSIPILKYVGSGGAIQYALQSAALVALRSWLFDEEIVNFSSLYNLSPGTYFNFKYYQYGVISKVLRSSDPLSCCYVKYGSSLYLVCFRSPSGSWNLFDESGESFIPGVNSSVYITVDGSAVSVPYLYGNRSVLEDNPFIKQYFEVASSDYSEFKDVLRAILTGSLLPTVSGLDSSYDVSLGDVAAEDVELPAGYPNWAIDSVQVPGGGGDEDPIPYVPIGIGESLEGTKTLTQTEVQSGQSTLVTDDEGTDVEVEGEVGGSISSGGSGGGDLPSGTEGPTVDDLVTMFAWLAVRIDEAVATIFPDLQVIKTYLRTIATWHETENVKYDSMLSYFMGWESDFDSMMNSLSSVDLKLSTLVADSSVIKSTLATISSNVQDIRDVIADPLDADINESQQDNKQSFLSNFGNKGQSDNIGSLGGLSDGFTDWFDLPDVDISLLWGQMDDGYSGFFSSQVKQGLALGGGSSATGVGLMSDSPIEYDTPCLDAWNSEVNSIFSGGGSD